jgi:hypothetical protein
MKKYYYDFHIHSCLSPCADDECTPYNIAGMAKLGGLDIIALTDHNSCKNCPAFFEACSRYGVVGVAGMELTTSEDIHAICLFEELESALEFDALVDSRRIRIPNRTDIFGNQLICDGEDNVTAQEPDFLSNATTVSIDELPGLVARYDGVCYPAHIDRQANGIIAVLGTFPQTPHFSLVEFNLKENIAEYTQQYSLQDKRIIVSSDAHYLENIKDAENYLELEESDSDETVRQNLFKLLR